MTFFVLSIALGKWLFPPRMQFVSAPAVFVGHAAFPVAGMVGGCAGAWVRNQIRHKGN
jgi:hypothetical protein